MSKSVWYLTISAVTFVTLMIVIVILLICKTFCHKRLLYLIRRYPTVRPSKDPDSDDNIAEASESGPVVSPSRNTTSQLFKNSDKSSVFDAKNDVNPPKTMPKEMTTFGAECLYLHNYYRSFHRQTKNLTHSDSVRLTNE